MAKALKWILRILAGAVAIVAIVALIGLVWLIYPGRPSASAFLRFDGYILLPAHGLFNVLDYLTLDGRTLFVTGTSSGSVFRIMLPPGGGPEGAHILDRTGEPRVHGVAVVASQAFAFATRSEVNRVDVFSLPGLAPVARIAVADDPDGILYDPTHDLIYVANGDAGVATLIDAARREKTGTIVLGGKPEFAALDPTTGLVYQNLESTNAVAAIDLGKRAVVGRWSLRPCEAPTGLAIDANLRRAFAVCGKNAMLVVLDLDSHRIVASVKIGNGPDSVAFDPSLHRIYTTGLSGEIAVVEQRSADRYGLLGKISTHFAAHTLAVDPVSHRVYVGYASLAVAPRIAVFSATR